MNLHSLFIIIIIIIIINLFIMHQVNIPYANTQYVINPVSHHNIVITVTPKIVKNDMKFSFGNLPSPY